MKDTPVDGFSKHSLSFYYVFAATIQVKVFNINYLCLQRGYYEYP